MKTLLYIILMVFTATWGVSVAQSWESDSGIITVSKPEPTAQERKDVILIHGFASSSDVWDGTAEQLSEDFNLHLVQINGFAGTESPEELPQQYLEAIRDNIIQYIKSNELDKPVVAGHSMGGLLSLMIASQNSELVSRVIVVDALPFYSLMFNPMATSEQIKPMAKQVQKQMLSLGDKQFAEQVKNSVGIMSKVKEKQGVVANWSLTSNRSVYANLIAEVMSYDARPELSSIQAPVVVINAFDKTMPMTKENLIKLYQNAYSDTKTFELHTIDNSYHFIMWDQPQEFYKQFKLALED